MAAPPVFADSIVYEKGGNVWVASPDGSGQRQLTVDGGYSRPSQADDGTIIAAKGDVLQRLDRSGRPLNTAGDDDYGGKIFTDLAPGGALASYGFFANGPILTGPYTAVSYANRPTEKEEIDGPLKGYFNSTWLDDSRLLLFPESLIVDVQIWPVPGDIQDWLTDPDLDLSGGEVDRSMTRFVAAARTNSGASILRFYRLHAPPPAPPEPLDCGVTDPAGTFFRPNWSPDGNSLTWEEDDGIHVMHIDLAACNGQSSLVIPGGHHPDWGPASAGAGGALTATAPRSIRLRALLRGISVKVRCSCTAKATLLLKGRAIGKATKAISGSAKMKVKPSRAGKARLKRGGKSVSVRVTGAGSRVTRKVKVVR